MLKKTVSESFCSPASASEGVHVFRSVQTQLCAASKLAMPALSTFCVFAFEVQRITLRQRS